MHIERAGRFRIDRPLADAFALLSPEGERLWVPGWVPRYLHPDGVASDAPYTVFTTDHNNEHTVWLIVRFSPREGVAEYLRLTPGSRVGVVTVNGSERDGGTDVEVTYRLTSLSEQGVEALEAMSPEKYSGMVREWETRIAQALAR